MSEKGACGVLLAVGQSLLIAVGLLLAALPMVLITVVLATKRPPSVTRAFLGGWVLGLAVVGSVGIVVADLVELGGPSPQWLSYVKIALRRSAPVVGRPQVAGTAWGRGHAQGAGVDERHRIG